MLAEDDTNRSTEESLDRRLWKSNRYIIFGLCGFIWFLSFKPSEPYLSEFLICNLDTQIEYCDSFSTVSSCYENEPCYWNNNACIVIPCSNVTRSSCGDDTFNYCVESDNSCNEASCYKYFSENVVNNDIYPWSTYAYFPFLLTLGPVAEVFSYRFAILVGISGRVVTRFLLIFGNSLLEMQLMQVAYSMGTAAEDGMMIFASYSICKLSL